jgi:DNA-binding transcriptional ArsR family regulator
MTTETEWAGPASALFRTLGSDTRLLILLHLRDGAKSAAELAGPVGVTKVRLGAHLQRLVRGHLVTTRREGLIILYALASENVFVVLDAAREMFEGRE